MLVAYKFALERSVPLRCASCRWLPDKFAPDNLRLDKSTPVRSQYDQSIGPSTSRLSGTLSPSLSISGLQFSGMP